MATSLSPDAVCSRRGGQLGLQPPAPPLCQCHAAKSVYDGPAAPYLLSISSQDAAGLFAHTWLALSWLSAEQLPSLPGPRHCACACRSPFSILSGWGQTALCSTHPWHARAEPWGARAGAVQPHVHTRVCAHSPRRSAVQHGEEGGPPGWQQTHRGYCRHINPAAPTGEWALTHTVKINDIYLLLIGSNKRPQ